MTDPGPILFRNASVLDATGAAPFRADVLVAANRIAEVRPHGSGNAARSAPAVEQAPAPEGTRVIDCDGATLMPGLIESHAHLSFVDTTTLLMHSMLPVEEHLLATLRHAKLYLESGFTSCFSAAAAKPRLDVVVRNAIDSGEHPGPRTLAASVQLTPTGGVGDLRQLHLDPGDAMYTQPCDGPIEFRRAAREACREGVDILKIVPSGDTSTPQIPAATTLMTEDEVAAVCDIARERGKRVAAHARSAASVKLCVRHGVDVVYHATCADEEALDMLESVKDRVFVAPALSVTWTRLHEAGKFGLPASPALRERIERDLAMTCERMIELKRRGVRVLPGGDYGFPWNPHGNNARDLAFFVDLLGFSPMEAIVAATRLGGELMGRGGELGVVREGALADLLLVEGDPLADVTLLQDRTKLRAIMKDGAFHKAPATH